MVSQSAAEEELLPHVVIVGGGFAGLALARGLKNAACRVTLIDRVNHHLFQPLLYQVATAALSAGEIAQPIRHMLRDCRNVTVLLGDVIRIDAEAKRVEFADGTTCPYDILVLAAGAGHSYFGHPEWGRFAPGLKTLADAQRIRNRLLLAFERAERSLDDEERRCELTITVVGGGPTGVELAGAIAELARESLRHEFRRIRPEHARVLLFEAGPRILPQFPDDLAAYAKARLERLGVTVRTKAPVEAVEARQLRAAGEAIATATVIWAAGVAATPLGRSLGVPMDRVGRVIVEPTLAVPGRPGVFALGDAAACPGDDGKPLPGLAQVADQQGRHLAAALRRHLSEGAPLAPFRYRDRGDLATIGRNAAVVKIGRHRLRGFLAWLLWGVVHVYLLAGFENRVLVTIRWLWLYMRAERSARLVLERTASGDGASVQR